MRRMHYGSTLLSSVLVLGCLFLCVPLHSQAEGHDSPPDDNESGTDDVSLPDLTTVIGGEDWQVAEGALPDYSLILPEQPPEPEQEPLHIAGTAPLPELPPSLVELASGASSRKQRKVFVEGFVEPAWPLSLDAEFSVYTARPESFFLDFGYRVVGGYGLEQAEDGFFHNRSFLQVGKTFSPGPAVLEVMGSYRSMDNGLQGQSLLFDDINRRGAGAQVQLVFPLGHGFSLDGGIPVDWYNRYAGFSSTVGRTELNGDIATSLFGMKPWLAMSWSSGDPSAPPKDHQLSARLLVDWNYWASLDPEVKEAQSRGGFALSGSWLWNSCLEVFGSVGLVYLPAGSGVDATKLLVPFTLGSRWDARRVRLAVEGGLDSRHRDFYRLEEREPYVNFTPSQLIGNGEESDWFFEARSTVSLLQDEQGEKAFFQELALHLGAEYRRSAFGNNVLTGNYGGGIDGWTGLFPSEIRARTSFATEMAVTLVASNFSFRTGWQAQWLYRPGYVPPQSLFLSCGYTSPSHPWGAELTAAFGFRGADSVPVVGAMAFYRPAENLHLAVNLRDMIKLFTGSQRVFVEPYMKESGAVSVSLQFNF